MHSFYILFLVLTLLKLFFIHHFVGSGPQVVTFLQNGP